MASKDNKNEELDLFELYNKERKRFKNSIKYSIEGLVSAFKEEGSLKLFTVMSLLIILCGVIFKIDLVDYVLSMFMMGIILVIELLNTAIESTVDLVTSKYHPLAKRAKDCASAAAFIFSILTFIGEVYIFFPHIQAFFK